MEHFDVSVCQRRRRAERLVSQPSVLPESPHFTCSTETQRESRGVFQLEARVLLHLENNQTVCVYIYVCVSLCLFPPLSCVYTFSYSGEHSVHQAIKQLFTGLWCVCTSYLHQPVSTHRKMKLDRGSLIGRVYRLVRKSCKFLVQA